MSFYWLRRLFHCLCGPCTYAPLETMGWETPALNLRWSLAKIRRASMWWHAGSTLYAAGVSRPWLAVHLLRLSLSLTGCVCVFVCVWDTRQEQESWQAAGISEDTADASPSREELGLSAPYVWKREQQNGQEGQKPQTLIFHCCLFTVLLTVDLLQWFLIFICFPFNSKT